MNNILEVKNLHKKYEDFSLQDISFSIPTGYIMGFIGPNGAGKTTTIKSILGMITPTSGTIHLLGTEISTNSIKIKDDIGVVMDLPFYVDEWKVKDVESAVSSFYSKWDHQTFLQLLGQFQLSTKKKVKDLSRGMKVKLMLAVALSHDAKLLILDEPTSGLDPVAREELMDILRDFIQDETKGVLFSTHITSDLERIADYITFIINGKMIFSGEKDALLERYLLVQGDAKEINKTHRGYIIGYREHSVGFEGIIKKSDKKNLPSFLSFDSISLDEIIIFINKEENLNHA